MVKDVEFEILDIILSPKPLSKLSLPDGQTLHIDVKLPRRDIVPLNLSDCFHQCIENMDLNYPCALLLQVSMADIMSVISEEQHFSFFSLCSEAKLHNVLVEFVFFSSFSFIP